METLNTAAFWLSPQQKRICSQAGTGPFRAACLADFGMHLEASKLRDAVRDLVSRHEILRTVFRRQPGMKVPFQVVLESAEPAWEVIDLSASSEIEQSNRIEEQWNRELHREFELERGPLLSMSLIQKRDSTSALLLALPSLCSDRYSLHYLLEEIRNAYLGRPAEDESLRYVQFAHWANDLLESNEDAAQQGKKFWAEHEASDYPKLKQWLRPDEAAVFSPSSLACDLDDRVRTLGEAIASRNRARISDILLAAWQCLFWRITSQHTFSIGVVLDGREYDELKNTAGLLAKTVPITGRFDGDYSFREALEHARDSMQKAMEWQEYFNAATLSDFPIGFEFADQRSKHKAEMPVVTLREYSCLEQFTLKLVAVESAGGGVKLEFHYDAGRLKRETVEQMAGYFQSLLTAAVERPETPVSRLPLLNEAERRQLLIEWNQTAADYPNACLHELFEAQAARTPERAALRCGEHLLSYRELNQRANQLAHHLRAQGVGPDALVGLCVERSAEMIVALLAILKAGGAYVPLNPDNPKPRLSQQLQSVVAVITERALQSQLPDFSGHLLCLDEQPPPWTSQPSTNPALITTPENLVYVIYTSGSTGVPKGVGVRHRNLVNYTQFMQRLLQLEQHPHGLHFATVSTLAADLGNTCIYPALVSGGCLHVIPYEVGTDAQRLARYTAQYPLDVLKIVPSHLAALLDSSEARHVLPRRYLITGGEALTRVLVEKVAASDSTCQLINHYGPTETTVGSLTLPVGPYASTNLTGETIPIGRPIANTQVYILDGQQQPVPVGVVGELYIAGAGVTAGYLNQTELTAERFLPNPFLNDARARMYRTGDLARYLPDGKVEFLGRSDDQVKIRGFRIELGEIEAVLSQHPAIKQAVVLARTDQRGDKRLVAYVVTRHPASADDLKHDLAQQLPDYMVPTAIVALAKFPLTANGKIDRQALPAPEQATAKAYVAPRTPTEEQVATIWAEVLKRHRLSVDDNFFELGGHSLLATQVVSRVREQFNVELAIRALFESPTIAGLSEAILSAQKTGQTVTSVIRPVAREAYRAKLS